MICAIIYFSVVTKRHIVHNIFVISSRFSALPVGRYTSQPDGGDQDEMDGGASNGRVRWSDYSMITNPS